MEVNEVWGEMENMMKKQARLLRINASVEVIGFCGLFTNWQRNSVVFKISKECFGSICTGQFKMKYENRFLTYVNGCEGFDMCILDDVV